METMIIPGVPIWLVAVIVLMPFVAASTAVLVAESRLQSLDRSRERCLGAIALLIIGIACALSVVHYA